MNEKIVNIAFTLASNRGAYAILLGSGVSRAAGIPTGWEITLDLIKQYAQGIERKEITKPEEWYRTKFNEEPNYSDVLNRIFQTSTERSRAIKGYIEASNRGAGEAKKNDPTSAHRAIARLVEMGIVKVIISTNFDRLMEKALEELKITPQVITNADDIRGSVPLSHSDSTLIKINGDYLDTRSKNTRSELNQYNRNLKKLLNGIVNDYGLIICGWSGEWDKSLVDSLLVKRLKRYGMYWVTKSNDLSEQAKKIIDHQNADLIPNITADEFFNELSESVTAIIEKRQTNLMSIEIAVELTKKYLAENKYSIKLHDLIMHETRELIKLTNSEEFRIDMPWSDEEFIRRISSYESKCEILLHILVTCSYWGGDDINKMVGKSFDMLLNSSNRSSLINRYSELSNYPVLFLLYPVLISALHNDNFKLFKNLLVDCKQDGSSGRISLVEVIHTYAIFKNNIGAKLPGQLPGRFTPVSDYLSDRLFIYLKQLLLNKNKYEDLFDRVEYYLALTYISVNLSENSHFWAPVGCFAWRKRRYYPENTIPSVFTAELKSLDERHPLLKSGLFNSSASRLSQCNLKLSEAVNKLPWG